MPAPAARAAAPLLVAAAVLAACALPEPGADEEEETVDQGSLVALLKRGAPVIGVFSGEKTRDQGALMARTSNADFILYDMETGPFDVPGMEAYMEGMEEAAGPTALSELPILLRVPPLQDEDTTRARLDEALPTGVAGIVFPHVTGREQAAAAARLMSEAWPQDPLGSRLDIVIVEDREGVDQVREIVSTPGLSVVWAGPGDLARSYGADAEAVAGAIQAILAACREAGVVCGITAGVHDIAARLDEGWGMIIATDPAAVAVGKAHAGREE